MNEVRSLMYMQNRVLHLDRTLERMDRELQQERNEVIKLCRENLRLTRCSVFTPKVPVTLPETKNQVCYHPPPSMHSIAHVTIVGHTDRLIGGDSRVRFVGVAVISGQPFWHRGDDRGPFLTKELKSVGLYPSTVLEIMLRFHGDFATTSVRSVSHTISPLT